MLNRLHASSTPASTYVAANVSPDALSHLSWHADGSFAFATKSWRRVSEFSTISTLRRWCTNRSMRMFVTNMRCFGIEGSDAGELYWHRVRRDV